MFKFLLILTNLLISLNCYAEIKVAVIDSGVRLGMRKLCDTGHKDFTGTGLQENRVHASRVVNIINSFAEDVEYCITVYKFYDPKNKNNLISLKKAIRQAILDKVDIINISGGGLTYDSEEKQLVLQALNLGIVIVAAAGNEKNNLDEVPYYPASYDPRVIVVGCKEKGSFNTGSIIDVYTKCNFGKLGSGTSYGTAIVTGALIKKISEIKK